MSKNNKSTKEIDDEIDLEIKKALENEYEAEVTRKIEDRETRNVDFTRFLPDHPRNLDCWGMQNTLRECTCESFIFSNCDHI